MGNFDYIRTNSSFNSYRFTLSGEHQMIALSARALITTLLILAFNSALLAQEPPVEDPQPISQMPGAVVTAGSDVSHKRLLLPLLMGYLNNDSGASANTDQFSVDMKVEESEAVDALALAQQEWDSYRTKLSLQEREFCTKLPFKDVMDWATAETAKAEEQRAWLDEGYDRLEASIDPRVWAQIIQQLQLTRGSMRNISFDYFKMAEQKEYKKNYAVWVQAKCDTLAQSNFDFQ